jgi:hypothetical protein
LVGRVLRTGFGNPLVIRTARRLLRYAFSGARLVVMGISVVASLLLAAVFKDPLVAFLADRLTRESSPVLVDLVQLASQQPALATVLTIALPPILTFCVSVR